MPVVELRASSSGRTFCQEPREYYRYDGECDTDRQQQGFEGQYVACEQGLGSTVRISSCERDHTGYDQGYRYDDQKEVARDKAY